MYPVNLSISKYSDVDESCSFCGFVEETAAHLFFDCGVTNKLWVDLSNYVSNLTNVTHTFVLKDFILYYENPKLLPVFLSEFDSLVSTLRLINNKKSAKFLMHYDGFTKTI